MTVGRPTLFTEELAALICSEIASGAKLTNICQSEAMPTDRTVYRWLASNEAFCQQYARAQSDRTNAMAEECLAIADDATDDVQRSRLRVDTRKWLMSKMAPKKYGEKVTNVHSDPDGNPISAAPTIIFTGSPAGTSAPPAMDGITNRRN